jgi:hypothetical protein
MKALAFRNFREYALGRNQFQNFNFERGLFKSFRRDLAAEIALLGREAPMNNPPDTTGPV